MTDAGQRRWYAQVFTFGAWGTVLGLWLVTVGGPFHGSFEELITLGPINIVPFRSIGMTIGYTLWAAYSVGIVIVVIGVILTSVGAVLIHVTHR